MNLNPFEKNVLKKVKIQPIEMSIQPVVLHLVVFEKDLKSLTLLSIQPIDS